MKSARLHGERRQRKLAALRKRDGDWCYYCRKALGRGSMTIDHVLPIYHGGTNVLENLVISCVACNMKKGSAL